MSVLKILITGSSGFIGSELYRHLEEAQPFGSKAEITCLVRDQYKSKSEPSSRARIIEFDLKDSEEHKRELLEFDYVFHVAASADVNGGSKEFKNNVDSTRFLLGALKYSKKLRRLIFVSSVGAVDRTFGDNCEALLNEESVPNPLTTYGKSKLEGEKLVQSSGLPYTIVRPTWVYGAGMRESSHLAVFIREILNNKLPFRINFPGKVSLIHVRDLVRSMTHLALRDQSEGEIYFITDGVPVSLGEIFSLIRATVGIQGKLIQIPSITSTLFTPLRAYFPFTVQNLLKDVLATENRKLIETGFHIERNFREEIVELCRWFCSREYKEKPLALVTGAAGGIGREVSKMLYARGYRLVLLDKASVGFDSFNDMEEIVFYQIDLSSDAELTKFLGREDLHLRDLKLCINCAGIGKRGNFDTLSLKSQQEIVRVNIDAIVTISHYALNIFRSRKSGTLINISSSAGFQPLPFMSVYAASKSFVLNFTEALVGEYQAFRAIQIHVVCPGGTDTKFQETAGVKKEGNEKLMTPAEAAAGVLSVLGSRSRTQSIGARTKAMSLVARFLPRSFNIKLWTTLMRRLR